MGLEGCSDVASFGECMSESMCGGFIWKWLRSRHASIFGEAEQVVGKVSVVSRPGGQTALLALVGLQLGGQRPRAWQLSKNPRCMPWVGAKEVGQGVFSLCRRTGREAMKQRPLHVAGDSEEEPRERLEAVGMLLANNSAPLPRVDSLPRYAEDLQRLPFTLPKSSDWTASALCSAVDAESRFSSPTSRCFRPPHHRTGISVARPTLGRHRFDIRGGAGQEAEHWSVQPHNCTMVGQVAFFVSGPTLIALHLRPQVCDMREAPDVELGVAEPPARSPVAQAGNRVRETRQLRACGLGHPGSTKAPGDHVGDKICDLHARGEVAVHEEWRNTFLFRRTFPLTSRRPSL